MPDVMIKILTPFLSLFFFFFFSFLSLVQRAGHQVQPEEERAIVSYEGK